jgi:hypothetical protein
MLMLIKQPLKDSPNLESSSIYKTADYLSLLSMRTQDVGCRDRLAIAVVVVILIILIAVGIYFALNLDIIQEPPLSVLLKQT